jgi:hypothetical protein
VDHTLIFDCEFLTAPGAPTRFWCGPDDPDPVVAQIGVVKLGLKGDFPFLDTLRLIVVPRGRNGMRLALSPLFVRLTGVTEEHIDRDGMDLGTALEAVSDFARSARLWSWGKDEFNMVAISCYVQGLAPPIPIGQFGNACSLMLKAGIPLEDIHVIRSNALAAHLSVDHPPLRNHDALDDAKAVAYSVQAMLRQGRLRPEDLG